MVFPHNFENYRLRYLARSSFYTQRDPYHTAKCWKNLIAFIEAERRRIDTLPFSAVITRGLKRADMIWISELGLVDPKRGCPDPYNWR
jgi:hypothetical protein